MRRKVLARNVRSVVEQLEGRMLLSATYSAGVGSAIISGVVYNDVNGNGIQDTGEPVIVATTVTLSEVGVTYAPGTVPTVQTDANGSFSFTSLAPGEYTVGTIPSAGFYQDAPGTFVVSVTANDSVAITVGETSTPGGGGSGLGAIAGTLFNDINQNGMYNPATEDFLSGDTVYLDLNGSGAPAPGDPTTTTNNLGQYTFTAAPGAYIIRVIPRPGFHQDPPGYDQVDVYSDQTVTQNIGENNRATLSGVVFYDVNSNGVQDPGELPVAGEDVELDDPTTGNFEFDATTDATGHFDFTGLTPGIYRVIVNSQAGLLQDVPGYIDVTVALGQDVIQNIGEGVPATITGNVYDDRNASGTLLPGDAGLPGQTVFLDINNNGIDDEGASGFTGVSTGLGPDGFPLSAEPTAITDASGNFIFSNVNPGMYTMRLVTPPGGIPTGPANATHSYTFNLTSGDVLQGQNFGFQTPDLTAEIVSFPTKPTLTHVPKTALVRITDVGSLPCIGVAGVDLWAQTTNTAVNTGTAFEVGAVGGRMVHLAVGQSKILRVFFSYPTQLPTNTYYVSAQVVSSVHDNDSANDFSAPVGPLKVTQPYIDLGLVYGGAPRIVDPGQPTSVSLVLTNTGNVASTGTVGFRIYLSQGPVIEPTDVVVQTTSFGNLRVKPGRSRIVTLTLPFPGENLGFRYINVYVDSGDTLGEMNLLNNTAIEPSPTRFD